MTTRDVFRRLFSGDFASLLDLAPADLLATGAILLILVVVAFSILAAVVSLLDAK